MIDLENGRVEVIDFKHEEVKNVLAQFYGYNDVKSTIGELDKGALEAMSCMNFEPSEEAKGFFYLLMEVRGFLERLDKIIVTVKHKPATISEMKNNSKKIIGVNA